MLEANKFSEDDFVAEIMYGLVTTLPGIGVESIGSISDKGDVYDRLNVYLSMLEGY